MTMGMTETREAPDCFLDPDALARAVADLTFAHEREARG